MKNKILFALLVLVVTFSLVGCGPRVEFFIGKWEKEYSGLLDSMGWYELFSDGTWTSLSSGGLGWIEHTGTWTWNGDNTATLVDEDGNEFTATRDVETETVIDQETGEEVKKHKAYLLINNTKYYRVKEESNN